MAYQLQSLPPRFKIINTIQSFEIKNKLIDMIGNLHRLLAEYDGFEPDAKTKHLVDRFFDYLLKSCENTKTLNLRGRWLMIYGGVIQDHLLAMRAYRLRTSVTPGIYDDSHLMVHLTNLTDAVARYRIVKQGQITIDTEVIQRLQDLVELGERVKPELDNTGYTAIVEAVDDYTQEVLALSHCRDVGKSQDEFRLISGLNAIRHMMNTYYLHQNFTLQPV